MLLARARGHGTGSGIVIGRLLLAALALALPATAPAQTIAQWQERIFAALVRQGVVSRERRLVSLKPVCTLSVGGKDWLVIDLAEHVPGARVPRGRNSIVVLDRAFKVIRNLDYFDEYPMACVGSRLFVHGDFGVDNTAPYGNVLDFQPDGEVVVTRIEANDLPIPLTGRRRTFRLP